MARGYRVYIYDVRARPHMFSIVYIFLICILDGTLSKQPARWRWPQVRTYNS
jgi:hypothetical protein